MSSGININSPDTNVLHVHLKCNTLTDCQSLPLPLSICKWPKTISYPLLSCADHRVLLWFTGDNDTIDPQATCPLEDNSLI